MRATSTALPIRVGLSLNFYGAPALTLPDFAGCEQDPIIGASLQVQRRWPVRREPAGQHRHQPRVRQAGDGLSQALGPWTFELTATATLFTGNDDFFGGTAREQDRFTMQAHVISGFRGGIWLAIDAT